MKQDHVAGVRAEYHPAGLVPIRVIAGVVLGSTWGVRTRETEKVAADALILVAADQGMFAG